jgi:hypothetical protein
MTKRSSQNEHITLTPNGMRGMAMPQLVGMQMKTNRSTPLAANITNRLAT